MPQIGANKISLRGDGPWHGMSLLSDTTLGDFTLLENVYVNMDGSEIRLRPGLKCVIDPTTTARDPTNPGATQGFERTTVDAERAVSAVVGAGPYRANTAPIEKMLVWSKLTQLHGMEQVRGRWELFGESSDRREPILDIATHTTPVYITSFDDNGANTDLTTSANYDNSVTAFNAVQVGDEILLTGLTGTDSGTLNNRRHTVQALPAANVIRIATTITAAPARVGQTGFIDRVTRIGSGTPSATVSDDVESLTTWTSLAAGNPISGVSEQLYQAYVANRQRDFGDTVGSYYEGNQHEVGPGVTLPHRSRRRQKQLPYRLVPHVAGNRLILVAPGYGCVFEKPAVVPINYDDNDFTFVDSFLGLGWFGNDIYDKPRALGVPKCVQLVDSDTTFETSLHFIDVSGTDASPFPLTWGGTSGEGAARFGTYQFKFAYKDEATGEVGLCSEPVSITTTNATVAREGIRLWILFPGYLMHESLALSINVYRTQKNDTGANASFFFDRTIPMGAFSNSGTVGAESAKYGLTPDNGAGNNYFRHVEYRAAYQSDASLIKATGTVPQTIEQMPMGAKAGRTVRGFTFLGGSLGDTGSRGEVQSGNMSLVYDQTVAAADSIYSQSNEITSQGPGVGVTSLDGGYMCAATGLPPAYSGQSFVTRALLPYPRQFFRAAKLMNTRVGQVAAFPWGAPQLAASTDIRYQIDDTPLRPEASYSSINHAAFLLLARGRVQISQPDNPNITPATSTTVIANEWDEDVEAIGDMHGQAVICTRNKTYLLGFSATPVGAPPEIASDRFGCIAPNSMVEFDGGCAWISDRGPCAMTAAGVEWIGKDLEQYFIGESSRYLRDSQGMMRHAFACHDAERGLIYFGLYTEQIGRVPVTVNFVTYGTANPLLWTQATDQQKSRWPCNEVLVYSYRVKAWSVWKFGETSGDGMAIKWMTRGQDVLGASRVFVLLQDNRIYVLDDMYGDINRNSAKNAVAADPSGNQTYTGTTVYYTGTTLGQGISFRNSDAYIQIGMRVLIYSSAAPFTVKALATVAGFSSTPSNNIVLDQSVTVGVGDHIVVGVKVGTMMTNYFNPKDQEASRLSKVGMQYHLWSLLGNTGGIFSPEAAAARFQNTVTRPVDGTMLPTTVNFSSQETNANAFDFLLLSTTGDEVYEKAATRAAAQGEDHAVTVTLVSGASLRVSDLYVEVQ